MIQLLLGDVGPLTVGHTRKKSLGSWKSRQMRRSPLAALQKTKNKQQQQTKQQQQQQQQTINNLFFITSRQLFVSVPQLKP